MPPDETQAEVSDAAAYTDPYDHSRKKGSRPTVRRKSYNFQSERLPRDDTIAKHFKALLLATYGKQFQLIAPSRMGVHQTTLCEWARGVRGIPVEAFEEALAHAAHRLLKVDEEYAKALELARAQLIAALASGQRLLTSRPVR